MIQLPLRLALSPTSSQTASPISPLGLTPCALRLEAAARPPRADTEQPRTHERHEISDSESGGSSYARRYFRCTSY